MAKPTLTLFLDVVSPFAYLAYHVTRTSPVFKDCQITYIPIFLGGVMKACGNTPPIQIKNKDKWIEVERLRWARLFNVPMCDRPPEGFPPLTLGVQRMLCAITLSHPDKFTNIVSAIFRAYWVDKRPITKPETLMDIISPILGEKNTRDVMEQSQTPQVKKLLTDNTDHAMSEGAFGLPWFVATNAKGEKECYWGFDHIGQVVDHLGLGQIRNPNESGWRAVL